MKQITKEKLKDLLEENRQTLKAIEDNKLNYIYAKDKLRYLEFADKCGTQKFKNRVYGVYDNVARDFIRNKELYRFYKQAVNEAISKNPNTSELEIRRYYLNMLDTKQINQRIQMALNFEIESKYYSYINLQGLIEESATDGAEIPGVGLLFKLNRKYYLQPKYDNDIIVVLGSEARNKELNSGFKLEKRAKATDNEVVLEIKRKDEPEYRTIVNIKKEKHYTEQEISEAFDKLTDKLEIYRYLKPQKRYYIMEYQKGYPEYEKYYNKIKEIVKNIGQIYEGYGNIYSPNYESMQTIKNTLEEIDNILRGNEGVRLINEVMKEEF